MIGIYKITNKITGKSYIGQSINTSKRIKEHFWKATCSKDVSFNSILHQAIRKYGAENFEIEILKECTVEELDELEKHYIKMYDTISPNGYNILEGGQKNRFVPNYCLICHKPLLSKARYCVECGHKVQQVCERPNREEFKQMIRKQTFVSIADKYGVTDKAISKWCKAYNLPFRKRDIKKYTDKEWEKL
jgi:group I intron endonuclease